MLTSRRWQQKLDSDMPTERPIRSFKSDLALANEIMETDFKLAEIKTVKDWLEEIADEFEPCELKHTHLQSTLDHITVRTRDAELGISKDLKTDVVTELDPDSMTRQKKNLVADDLEYEQQLNKTIFKYLRSGRLQDALEFCRDCHQFYKAATLQGGLVHCDPIDEEMTRDVDDPEPRQKEPMGNQNRSLWKAACLQLACDSRVDHYERAIYGALAGDVQSVLSVCNTWEDYLWAYFNGIIESRLQKQLCSSGNQMSENKTSFTLPLIELSENQVFERLMEKENLQKERNEFYHLIQKHCIIGEYGNLFQYFNSVLDQFPMNQLENTFSLRFLAHFILLWRNLEFDDTNDLTQRILLKYIDYLIASENGELVPMFYEPLPRQVQTVGYATFLSNLQDDKTKFYKLGQSFRLNMREICVETVRMITGKLLDAPISLESSRTLSFTPISQPLTEEDSILISSLAWFTFETEQIKSLFEYCNKLLRRYLILGKLNCVKWIMDHYSLSSSEIDVDDWAIDPVFQTEQTDYFSLIACVEAETNWRNLQAKKPIQE